MTARPLCSEMGCHYLSTLIVQGVYLCSGHAWLRTKNERRRHEGVAQRPVLAARGDGR